MSDSYSCWGKDWDDWLKHEEQRQEEHRFDREEIEEETMNERCLRCGELLYSEAIKRYEGYCANCYPHKKDLDTINQLQARVKELETENTDMREQIEHHCLSDCCCDWCIERAVKQEANNE